MQRNRKKETEIGGKCYLVTEGRMGFETEIEHSNAGLKPLEGITEFTMRFVPGTCEMKFCQQGKEHKVLIATDGSWRWNRLKLDGRVNSELCLSGYWEDKNCFVVHARWVETCYENELKFCFEKDQVHMSRMNKVGRYMTLQQHTATAQKA